MAYVCNAGSHLLAVFLLTPRVGTASAAEFGIVP